MKEIPLTKVKIYVERLLYRIGFIRGRMLLKIYKNLTSMIWQKRLQSITVVNKERTNVYSDTADLLTAALNKFVNNLSEKDKFLLTKYRNRA